MQSNGDTGAFHDCDTSEHPGPGTGANDSEPFATGADRCGADHILRKEKLELPGLVIDNTRHEISANGRNISLTRLESDLLWVLAVCEGTTLSKKELLMLYGERIAPIP